MSKIVDDNVWLEARIELLKKEKEFTRLRDELTKERRRMPWRKVEKPYTFQTPDGAKSLAELFNGRGQLIVYHFMYAADWGEGCKSCSLAADHYGPSVPHLRARDVELVTVSKAPLATLEAYKKRMGWEFPWVSAADTDFNEDYHVSFAPEQIEKKETVYNYRAGSFPMPEAPGLSVFAKNDAGAVFHTYSVYARGLEPLLGVYQLLDWVPKGRDEDALAYGMEWVKRHDEYGSR